MLRVYALWNRSLRILLFSLAAFFLNIGTFIILVAYNDSKAFILPAFAPFTGCAIFPGFAQTYIIFVTAIIFETIMVVLTVMKSYPLVRQRGLHTPLFTLLLEDGLLYYIFIIGSQIINLVAIFTHSWIGAAMFMSYPSVAVITVACNRLLLRPQRALLGTGLQMTSAFRSYDLRTASITLRDIPHRRGSRNTNHSFLSRDLPGERLEIRDKSSAGWPSVPRLSKKRASILFVDGYGSSQSHNPVHEAGSNLDTETGPSNQYLRGITVQREDVQQVDGDAEHTEVLVSSEGGFSYGSRSNVLDSGGIQDSGALRISRIGRYD